MTLTDFEVKRLKHLIKVSNQQSITGLNKGDAILFQHLLELVENEIALEVFMNNVQTNFHKAIIVEEEDEKSD